MNLVSCGQALRLVVCKVPAQPADLPTACTGFGLATGVTRHTHERHRFNTLSDLVLKIPKEGKIITFCNNPSESLITCPVKKLALYLKVEFMSLCFPNTRPYSVSMVEKIPTTTASICA